MISAFAARKKPRIAEHTCPTCGSHSVIRDDHGGITCRDCGAVIKRGQEVVSNADPNLIVRVRGNAVVRKQAVVRNRVKKAPQFDVLNVDLCLKGFQSILECQVNALKPRLGKQFDEIASRTKALWFRYCDNLLNSSNQVLEMFYPKRWRFTGSKDSLNPCPIPTLSLSLAFLVLAARQTGTPLLAWDVHRWAKNGVIPYLHGMEILPEKLRNGPLKRISNFFVNRPVPSCKVIVNHVLQLQSFVSHLIIRPSSAETANNSSKLQISQQLNEPDTITGTMQTDTLENVINESSNTIQTVSQLSNGESDFSSTRIANSNNVNIPFESQLKDPIWVLQVITRFSTYLPRSLNATKCLPLCYAVTCALFRESDTSALFMFPRHEHYGILGLLCFSVSVMFSTDQRNAGVLRNLLDDTHVHSSLQPWSVVDAACAVSNIGGLASYADFLSNTLLNHVTVPFTMHKFDKILNEKSAGSASIPYDGWSTTRKEVPNTEVWIKRFEDLLQVADRFPSMIRKLHQTKYVDQIVDGCKQWKQIGTYKSQSKYSRKFHNDVSESVHDFVYLTQCFGDIFDVEERKLFNTCKTIARGVTKAVHKDADVLQIVDSSKVISAITATAHEPFVPEVNSSHK